MTDLTFPSPSAAPQAILIGGSAGALEVVSSLLAAMPSEYPYPFVVVLHVARKRPSGLVEALNGKFLLPVREPQDREPLARGTVYVAPPDYHMLIDPGPVFALSVDEPVNFSIPSIDVLFESAADVLGPRSVAILLSGSNADGAAGLRAIHEAGGLGIVQVPQEAAQSAMPAAALAMCPEARVLSTEGICQCLQQLGTSVTGPER